MEPKLKIYILGSDRALLNNVLSKINTSRPVEASLYTDLKEFLAITMSAPPDIFAVSVDYPHPKIGRFPKVFRMAMNLPVIVFGETSEASSRKAVSICQADYKINGKITAHNLWMKIVNFQREAEEKENQQDQENLKKYDASSSNKISNSMAALLSQLGSDSSNSSEKNHHHIKSNASGAYGSSSGSRSTHVQSSMATKYQRGTNSVTNMMPQDDYLDDEGSLTSLQKSNTASGNNQHSNGFQEVASLNSAEENELSQVNMNVSSGGSFNPNELNSLLNGGFMDSVGSFDGDISIDNHIKSSEQGEDELSGSIKNPSMEINPPSFNESDKGSISDPGMDINGSASMSSDQDEVDNKFAQLLNDKKEKDKQSKAQKNLEPSNRKVENPKEKENSPLDRKSKDSKPAESTVDKAKEKESEVATKENKKGKVLTKEEKRKEFERQVSILEDACNIALPECFPVEPLEESRSFDIESLAVFSINQPSFKGYILFANSFNHKEDRTQSSDMESIISDYLDKNGMMGGIGNFFEFNVPSVEYTKWVQETCEFTVQYEDDSGKQYFLSFLPREKVLPPYSDADLNKDMIRVDLQHIPPNTPVDFDAFIHLPLNKRYVRYLKKERSIGLDQAKRLLKDSEHKRLFVQKCEKQKFIQFYIKNAIYWEIMAYKKQNAA